MNVMIVEDEIILALNLEDDVHFAGHRSVGFAASCREALALAPQADLAFVDVRLRDGIEGPNIARRLIDEFGMNVVFLTGNPETVAEFAGALGVLSKPVHNDDIAAVLRYVSARSSGDDAPAPKRLTLAA